MTFVVYRSQGSASLRRIPMWLVTSDGTSPATAEAAGQPQINWIPRGAATVNTSATLSLVSANAGEYFVELTASEVSALGAAKVHYRSANAIANSTPFEIVNYDSGDSMRLGQFALPNAAAEAAGGLPTEGTGAGQISLSNGSVGLKAQTHSQATVGGADNLGRREYSDVTVRIGLVAYSGATVGVDDIAPNTHSDLTVRIEGVDYSDLTIQGVTRTLNLNTNDDKTDYTLTAAGRNLVAVDSADSVWDELYTDHTVVASFGQRLSALTAGTAQNGAASSISLAAAASALNDFYNDARIKVTSGTGVGQARIISDYVGASRLATVEGNWITNPDSTSVYVITEAGSITTVAGDTNTATLIAALNDIDGSAVTLHAGTHSDVTIQGLVNDSVITIAGVVNSATLINALNDIDGSEVTLHVGTHSDVTITGLERVGSGGIVAASFAAGAMDAAAAATDFGQEMADRVLARDLAIGSDSAADGRSVQNALRLLRNRVDASSSVLTVFQENDSTSAWTASVSTSDDPGHINEINPL